MLLGLTKHVSSKILSVKTKLRLYEMIIWSMGVYVWALGNEKEEWI